MTGGFRSQMVSNAENVSIWWRHHVNKHIKTDIYTIVNNDRILLVWTTGCGWRHTMTDEKTLRKFHGFLWLQWEFQIGPCEGIDIGDHLWMARFILARVAEDFRAGISFECKPVAGDYVGPTANVNVSTIKTRKEGGMRWVQWAWRTVTCTFCVCVFGFLLRRSGSLLRKERGGPRHTNKWGNKLRVTVAWRPGAVLIQSLHPANERRRCRGGLGWVLDGDAQHCPLTRNATKGQKGVSKLYISPSFDLKYGSKYDIFFPFLLKYRGRNYTNFPEAWKRGSKWRSICSNLL